ncbi:DUF1624 domain-containing protein [Pseudomonas sp. KNUC1026]|uniref:DUF1624 domain-containing protein n=1 Tax=Pseudomonas sp. KNUC1026 TaxID=2893890 RepID=UPI001F356B85|nr:heparan-alpha-glucosaminide N-acetyltransferase domain-containing protein [Pseudomonas sp. KNUC1026]UFH50831.1 heparan-alpha-glucosaminide N-acetyltransferase domain-containing protein [Pseudomonas sp. KNUC1026]
MPSPHRLRAIDALRGLVMLLMLFDHLRDTFFLQYSVDDPMDLSALPPGLFFSRLLTHLCAPVFVFLTGLAAWLFGQRQAHRSALSIFLLKRGLFLIVLELTLVNFAWTFALPPDEIFLQVIWAIGVCMLALAGLLWLPRAALVALAVLLVAGHNLLDGVHLPEEAPLHGLWTLLHDPGWLSPAGLPDLKVTYPVMPWIGVIALGYAAGPWYGIDQNAASRRPRLLGTAAVAIALFTLLRLFTGYGEVRWLPSEHMGLSLMSFFNLTKYPPSLAFITLMLGVGLVLLALLERFDSSALSRTLATLGGAPMFFYLAHLLALRALYLLCVALWGYNREDIFALGHLWQVWLASALLALALYWPTRAFARLKARRKDLPWLRYF